MLDWTQDTTAGLEFPSEPDRLADEEGIFPQRRKPGSTDWIFGAGASFTVHVAMLAAALLSTFFISHAGPREVCFTVSLVDAGGGCGIDAARNGGSEAAPGAQAAQPFQNEKTEEAAPHVAQPESLKAPQPEAPPPATVTRPVKRVEAAPNRDRSAKASNLNTSQRNHSVVDSSQCEAKFPGADASTGVGHGVEGVASGGQCAGKGASGGEFEAHMVDQKPVLIRKAKPVYPPRARQMGIVGKVLVKFLVEPDGSIARPLIVDASPRGVFEQSVLESVVQMRFKPGYFRGKAVSVWVTAPVQFRLTDEDEY